MKTLKNDLILPYILTTLLLILPLFPPIFTPVAAAKDDAAHVEGARAAFQLASFGLRPSGVNCFKKASPRSPLLLLLIL